MADFEDPVALGARDGPSILRTLQTLKIRPVKVTLNIANHLNGGPAVNSTQHIYLLVPALPASACPVPTGQVSATTIGPVSLGSTRARMRQLLPRFTKRNAHTDNFCLSGGPGIRVGYATQQVLGLTAQATHATQHTSIVLALTANRFYQLHNVRPGASLATAAHNLKLGSVIHSGLNDWYVIPGQTVDGHGRW